MTTRLPHTPERRYALLHLVAVAAATGLVVAAYGVAVLLAVALAVSGI